MKNVHVCARVAHKHTDTSQHCSTVYVVEHIACCVRSTSQWVYCINEIKCAFSYFFCTCTHAISSEKKARKKQFRFHKISFAIGVLIISMIYKPMIALTKIFLFHSYDPLECSKLALRMHLLCHWISLRAVLISRLTKFDCCCDAFLNSI